jgi:hypothetical protein
MAIFDFFRKKEAPKTETIKLKPFGSDLKTFNITVDYSQPVDYLNKTARGYLYGVDGFLPQELNRLYNASPLHSAIINFKKLLTVGGGLDYSLESLDGSQKISAMQILTQFEHCLKDIAMDFFIHSRVCLKVTWNADFTKIIKIKRISPEKIRIAEVDEDMEATKYLYNYDWRYTSKYPTKEYPAFSTYNTSVKKEHTQIYVFQTNSPGQRLYAEPSYLSALNWVVLDAEMSAYHKANILNSINPSILIQYFERPGSREERQQILADLNQSFAGSRKTGRAMVTFSDGKDLAPTVTQLQPNQLDKTFLSLTDVIQRQICYAHQTDPLLLGLKTPGSLGNSAEFPYVFQVFNQSVIFPAQNDIEEIIDMFLAINKVPIHVKLVEPEITNLNTQQ